MNKSILALTAGLCGLGLLFAGCSDSDRNNRSTSNLQIEITDAPFQFDAVSQANIVVSGISAIGSDGIVPIDSQTRIYDLVGLQNGTTAILTSVNLPEGDYGEFRIVVEDATITLTDGRSFALKVPSGGSSGIKVKLDPPLTITTGLSERLILDFDLSRSFSAIPNSAKKVEDIAGFRFHPVVRGAIASDTGEIAGQVLALVDDTPVADATITVVNQAGDFEQTVASGADGTFVIAFLPPDLYTVSVETLEGLTATSELLQVTVGNRVEVMLKP